MDITWIVRPLPSEWTFAQGGVQYCSLPVFLSHAGYPPFLCQPPPINTNRHIEYIARDIALEEEGSPAVLPNESRVAPICRALSELIAHPPVELHDAERRYRLFLSAPDLDRAFPPVIPTSPFVEYAISPSSNPIFRFAALLCTIAEIVPRYLATLLLSTLLRAYALINPDRAAYHQFRLMSNVHYPLQALSSTLYKAL